LQRKGYMNLPTGIILREAKNEDSQKIKDLVFSILKEYDLQPDPLSTDSDLLQVYNFYQAKGGDFAVLEKGEEILGCAGLYYLSKSECELRKMYLHSSLRGKGLGRFLLEKMINRAIELNFNIMRLETASVLKEAISLYTSFGFHEIRTEHMSCRCDQSFELDLSKYSVTSREKK
jgi:N-acetylglutamate synthase-like GNAT family acetyltransferase